MKTNCVDNSVGCADVINKLSVPVCDRHITLTLQVLLLIQVSQVYYRVPAIVNGHLSVKSDRKGQENCSNISLYIDSESVE